ncbi:hypothetical protein SCHPADRAFT_615999 [Schizopora paradoxa]|uniref:Uncharacterized protein n=1 Tax=Schizopora paradoxa TaxID=27342 RepID=A0A0H2R8S6_9AGAM|nr:hypothetical protein SCHPADRAFT_615999 [Schizopora paradoxa]
MDEKYSGETFGSDSSSTNVAHSPRETELDVVPHEATSSLQQVRRELGKRSGRLDNVGTNLGLLLPSRLLSPGQYANQIRRLCRHDKTTVVERHSYLEDEYQDLLTQEEKRTLTKLCERLLELTTKDSTRDAAEAEVIALMTNDPLVRFPMRSTIMYSRVEGVTPGNEFGNAILFTEMHHQIWSGFIGGHKCNSHFPKISAGSLIETLTNRNYFPHKVPIAYLSLALSTEMEGEALDVLRHLWYEYLDYLHRGPSVDVSRHIQYLDTHVKSILSSGNSLDDFISVLDVLPYGRTRPSLFWFLILAL